jgi:hypothetical protein
MWGMSVMEGKGGGTHVGEERCWETINHVGMLHIGTNLGLALPRTHSITA